MRRQRVTAAVLAVTGGLATVVVVSMPQAVQAVTAARRRASRRTWLAGDHHVHSRFSVGSDTSTTPPTPILGGDAIYPIPTNAANAKRHGLAWMVSTDHGGPLHSKLNAEQAYPELLDSRRAVPDLLQFYGMEFDTPAADHTSLIIPKTWSERDVLFELESRFAKYDAFPPDQTRDTEPAMLAALQAMQRMHTPPVLFANHPARSATGLGIYGQDTPAKFRAWNDAAPTVAVGFEGAPGHQAATLNPNGSVDPAGARGAYGDHPTMGGFDQLTARLGGLWDALLGEGRHWWVTSNSDSHVHFTEGGADFWPGEYSKTYVFAGHDYADILDGLRHGRMFVTTGDLIDRLDLRVRRRGSTPKRVDGRPAAMGQTLRLRGPGRRGMDIEVRVRQPEDPNARGERPRLARLDLITGMITGSAPDRTSDTNPTTRVLARYGPGDWHHDGDWLVVRDTVADVPGDMYLRVRGTNTDDLEPAPDPPGADPWTDLWCYSNPVFIQCGSWKP